MMLIDRTRLLLLLSVGITVLESGNAAKEERVTTRKPTIDELPLQHILLRSIMRHDGCRLYYPWSNLKNPSFELNNATCYHGCKIVGDLYEERYPDRPRLIRSGGCTKGLRIVVLECKCELSSGFLRWRSLKHCAHKYLDGIVDFSINDTRPTTTETPEDDYDDDYDDVPRTRLSPTTNIMLGGGTTDILTEALPTMHLTSAGFHKSTLIGGGASESSTFPNETTSEPTTPQKQLRKKKKQNKPWRKKFG